MQRQEDLQKQDEDWLSFFLGMTSSARTRPQEEAPSSQCGFAPETASPIMTQPPAEAEHNPFAPIVPEIYQPAAAPLLAPKELPAVIQPSEPEPKTQDVPVGEKEIAPPAVHQPCLDDIFSELITENKIFKRANAI
jgi:hypothetical protein